MGTDGSSWERGWKGAVAAVAVFLMGFGLGKYYADNRIALLQDTDKKCKETNLQLHDANTKLLDRVKQLEKGTTDGGALAHTVTVTMLTPGKVEGRLKITLTGVVQDRGSGRRYVKATFSAQGLPIRQENHLNEGDKVQYGGYDIQLLEANPKKAGGLARFSLVETH